jgi:hypothetical protein
MAFEIDGFTMSGRLTQAEWARVLQVLREIDQTHPEQPLNLTIQAANDATMDEAEAMLRATWAPSPNPAVTLDVTRIPTVTALPVGKPKDDRDRDHITGMINRQLLRLTDDFKSDLYGSRLWSEYLNPKVAWALGNLAGALDKLRDELREVMGVTDE